MTNATLPPNVTPKGGGDLHTQIMTLNMGP